MPEPPKLQNMRNEDEPHGLEARFQKVDDLLEVARLQESVAENAYTIADRYRVLRTLGQGGMGAVYEAVDTRLHRNVAVKTILPQYLSHPDASRRFLREAEALARLNHPNILTLFDYGQSAALHFLVMELGGRDLSGLLKKHGGPMPLHEVLYITRGIARALAYAHRQGVVHRDLKPANILVGGPGDGDLTITPETPVKVMDFGLAKVQGASAFTAPEARLGTPQYMSPEQVLGREADARADLYALGVVLYELCTGIRPFDSDDVQAIFAQHLNLAPIPPSALNPELPQGLEMLILRLLEKDPVRRMSSADEALRVIERFIVTESRGEGSSFGFGSPMASEPEPSSRPSPSLLQSPLVRLPARTMLVGRIEQMDFLKTQFEAVAAGAGGRLVLVTGEPGVGKTRLVHELGVYARQRGGAFLEGRYLREGTPPFAPWVEALRGGLRLLAAEDIPRAVGPYGAELCQILPELADKLAVIPAGPQLTPEEQRLRLYDGIAEFLRELSEACPLVVLLDNMHWAPGMTLLTHLAQRLDQVAALIVVAYRPQELSERQQLVRQQVDLHRERQIPVLSVGPLSEDQTLMVVRHTFGEDAAAILGPSVYQVTRGNPFFVQEVLRSLVETAAVQPGEKGWEVVDRSAVRLPDSVRVVVEERVTRLGEPTREVLVQAAILGHEFSFPVLQTLAGVSEDGLLEHLERAVSARILQDRVANGEELYAFSDEQVREVLYGNVSGPRRRRLHLRAGQALETVYAGSIEAHVEELAHHFSEANQLEKGAEYAFRAGTKADRLLVWSRAIPWYRKALEQWESSGEHREQRAAVYQRLGEASWKSMVDAPASLEYLSKALTLYEQLGSRPEVARIQTQLGREYAYSGNVGITDLRQALHHFHLARSILESETPSVELSSVYVGLAVVHAALLELDASVEWASEARDVGEVLGNPTVISDACGILGLALAYQGHVGRSLLVFEEGWKIGADSASAHQADFLRAQGTRVVGPILKDPRGGLAWAGRQPDFRTLGSLLEIPAHRVVVNTLLGDVQAAAQESQELQARLKALGQPSFGRFPAALAFPLLRQGAWDDARLMLEEGLQWARAGGYVFGAAQTAQRLGELHHAVGELQQADDLLRWALEQYRRGGAVLLELSLLARLVRVSLSTGASDAAAAWFEDGRRILERPEDWRGLAGEFATAEGALRMSQGRRAEANAAFARGVEIDQRYGLRWDEAEVYYVWGCALVAAGSAEGGRARELLTRAAELWEQLGAGPWSDKCRVKLAQVD